MPTVSTVPAIPVPNRPVGVYFTLTGSGTNYVRVWCTVAPDGSSIAKRIASGRRARLLVYEGPGGLNAPWRGEFDKGGAYTLIAQEYVKSGGWGGGYEGDPRGAPTETQVGAEVNLSLCIAQRLTQQLGAGSDTATLVIFVLDQTIVRTLAAIHGEYSPAITAPTSDRAKSAATSPAVADPSTGSLIALVGTVAAAALGVVGSVVDNMIAKFAAHANNSGGVWHQTADDESDLATNYTGSTSLGGVATALNKLRTRLGLHMQNSKENDSAHPEYQLPGGITIHSQGGLTLDLQNALLPVVADENNQATIYAAIGDTWRAFESHRIASMHETPDSSNGFAVLAGLLKLHRDFMVTLGTTSAPVPLGQSTGAANLIAFGGFEET